MTIPRFRTFVLAIVILLLVNTSLMFAQDGTAASNPADTTKKSPPVPLVTYPLSIAGGKSTLAGYALVRYQYFTDTPVNNGFDVRGARLSLAGSPFKNFDSRLQADFAPFSRVMDVTAAYIQHLHQDCGRATEASLLS